MEAGFRHVAGGELSANHCSPAPSAVQGGESSAHRNGHWHIAEFEPYYGVEAIAPAGDVSRTCIFTYIR